MTTNSFISFCLLLACMCLGCAAPLKPALGQSPQLSTEDENIVLRRTIDLYVDGVAKAVLAAKVKPPKEELENWELPLYLVRTLKGNK